MHSHLFPCDVGHSESVDARARIGDVPTLSHAAQI